MQAGLTALVAIFVILTVALRRMWDVAMTLGPLVLATLWTLMALRLLEMLLNFVNIIALPLVLAVGVVDMLASSLTRAIFFSALATGTAFGSLMLPSHPGTAGMGKPLALSLTLTLLSAFFVVQAFFKPPPSRAEPPLRNA